MNKERLFSFLHHSTIRYKDILCDFLKTYMGYLESLLDKVDQQGCSSEEAYMIRQLVYWFDEEGCNLFSDAIARLNDETGDKIKGFVDLYSFLLSNSSDSIEKLVDHLFYIPGEFFREFMGEYRVFSGKLEEKLVQEPMENEVSYTVTGLGISKEIPNFIRIRRLCG